MIFKLPVLFLACFHYHLAEAEGAANWSIDQPIKFVFPTYGGNVEQHYLKMGTFCRFEND